MNNDCAMRTAADQVIEHRSAADFVRSVTPSAAWPCTVRAERCGSTPVTRRTFGTIVLNAACRRCRPARSWWPPSALGVGHEALTRRLAAIDHQRRQRGILPPDADPSGRAVMRQVRRTAPRRARRRRLRRTRHRSSGWLMLLQRLHRPTRSRAEGGRRQRPVPLPWTNWCRGRGSFTSGLPDTCQGHPVKSASRLGRRCRNWTESNDYHSGRDDRGERPGPRRGRLAGDA